MDKYLDNFSVIPENLDQASDIISVYFDKEQKNTIISGKLYPSMMNMKLGSMIRNEWRMWLKSSPIVIYFNKLGIYHPDDMTDIILTKSFKLITKKPYDLMAHIENIREYWKRIGEDPDNLNIK